MSSRRALSSGVVGLLVLGVGGWVATVGFPLGSGVEPLGATIEPDGLRRHLVCTGGVIGHVADSADFAGVQRTTVDVVGGSKTTDLELASKRNGSVLSRDGSTPAFAATESVAVKTPQIVGYLATECGDAHNDQWLVGGSTETGRETTLVLSNGSDVDARVDIDIWGTNGAIDAPGSQGIVVPAHAQRAYSVAGFAPEEPAPALHVVSTGAAVWATLQMTAVRGLVPGGLDRIGSVEAPKPTLAFPVFRIPDEKAIGPVLGDPLYSDVPAALRLLNPGDLDAEATLVFTPARKGESHEVTTTVTAGVVSDIALSDLPAGDWSVTVISDQPLVGAVRMGYRNAASRVTDVAWASAAPINARSSMLIAPVNSTLGVINPSDHDITVTVTNSDTVVTYDIAAGGTLFRDTEAGIVMVESSDPIATSIVVENAGGIATVRGLATPRDADNVAVTFG